MCDHYPMLLPRTAFAGLPVVRTAGRGVVVIDRDGLGIAIVLARKNKSGALMQRLRERFLIELPHGPHRVCEGDLAFAGIGPQAWLATLERGGNAFAGTLREALADLASVSDQSDGHAVLRLTGPNVRDVLSKLVPVDVHPRAFEVGHVAVTAVGHIEARLWRLMDGADGAAVFEISVFRSMAASFWHALSQGAAEFGFELADPDFASVSDHGFEARRSRAVTALEPGGSST